jgi:GH25 family lysozyme M1 (1,4-beta-N-acetylmuramidase)
MFGNRFADFPENKNKLSNYMSKTMSYLKFAGKNPDIFRTGLNSSFVNAETDDGVKNISLFHYFMIIILA